MLLWLLLLVTEGDGTPPVASPGVGPIAWTFAPTVTTEPTFAPTYSPTITTTPS